jgi:nicotinate dehydrogenase subunit B
MAPVVKELAAVPDSDIRAMAVYLASFTPASPEPQTVLAAQVEARTAPTVINSLGARIYDGACAVCHQPGRGQVLFGVRPSLALNSNLHGVTPDSLIRVILDGIASPALPELGAMPGFRTSLDDAQTAELVRYLRAQFAPGQPAWDGVEQTVARLRGS